MTAWENPLLALIAVLTVMYGCYLLFLFIRNIFRNPGGFFAGVGFLAAIAGGIIGIGAILAGGVLLFAYFQEQATLKQCLTAHERRAYADAAPDDYFGRKLRDDASAETKTCAELAAKKEAEAKKATATAK